MLRRDAILEAYQATFPEKRVTELPLLGKCNTEKDSEDNVRIDVYETLQKAAWTDGVISAFSIESIERGF